ncbi:MAG: glycosyltransferase family 4 protein, partial [Chloroflexi bacterium]|nr:glycosyltransferase family 4 protein [Chloroflexota bacterium]
EKETLLCYLGFLNESKGGETLIRALALIPNAKLLMIGGQVGASDPTNAAYLARVQTLIDQLDLRARVIWTDYAPPEIVSAYFFAADLCVLPYRDGASFRRGTLMAALAHGCAIITTIDQRQWTKNFTVNRPSSNVHLPELVDEENCLLVEPDDPRALADAIQRAAHSRDLREKIRAGARTLAQNFT